MYLTTYTLYQYNDLWVSSRFVFPVNSTRHWKHTFQAKRPQWTNYSVISNRKYNNICFFIRGSRTGQNSYKKHSRNCIAVRLYVAIPATPFSSVPYHFKPDPLVHFRRTPVHTQTLLSSSSSVLRSTFHSSIAYIVFWGWKYVVPVASRHKVFFIVI